MQIRYQNMSALLFKKFVEGSAFYHPRTRLHRALYLAAPAQSRNVIVGHSIQTGCFFRWQIFLRSNFGHHVSISHTKKTLQRFSLHHPNATLENTVQLAKTTQARNVIICNGIHFSRLWRGYKFTNFRKKLFVHLSLFKAPGRQGDQRDNSIVFFSCFAADQKNLWRTEKEFLKKYFTGAFDKKYLNIFSKLSRSH